MPVRTIVLATRNPGKLKEIRQVLGGLAVHVSGLEEFTSVGEPEEHGATFAENARDKALYYAQACNQWCLADDSGLVVDALAGRPGVHSARYAAADCPPSADRHTIDQANNAKLLRELSGLPDSKRTARFVCHLALAMPGKVLLEASDSIEGRIIDQASGQNGFGYDPLFFIDTHNCTTAQLPSEEKNRISHRGKALRKFAAALADLLKTNE